MDRHCGEVLEEISLLPQEVQFGIQRDDDYYLYFNMTGKKWFDEIFEKRNDGIAIDVINKNQISCTGQGEIHDHWMHMGKLLTPIYLKDMEDNMFQNEMGQVFVKAGRIPSSMRGEDLEYNLIIIKDGYMCYYQRFYDLERYRWDILDMGLYLDSVEYGIHYDTTQTLKSQVGFMNSRMKFEIPFEKNKWSYKAEDIKPFYDSLKLENFNINKIEIRAYSSVEGSVEKNNELQQKRAQSIIDVLQENQLEEIEKKILTSENWVEFYRDITGTRYANFVKLQKDAIKEKLTDKSVANNLEPILSKHRKAVIILDAERKTSLTETKEELIASFQKAIEEENVQRARDIQRSIFNKIMHHELSPEALSEIEIPRKVEFSVLHNHQAAFNHFLHPEMILETYGEFRELAILFPKDKRIRYNLIALKFRVWLLGLEEVDPDEFKTEIKALKEVRISKKLIRRMRVNYQIIMSEIFYFQGEFQKKDEALADIKKNYKYLDMSDFDLLSLAQYFASYARYDWATELLYPHIKRVDANEDLLFYYINLTIVDDDMIKRDSYNNILLNAVSVNRVRFCNFFEPIEKGGASFQLLFNNKLKEIYCQDCQGKML